MNLAQLRTNLVKEIEGLSGELRNRRRRRLIIRMVWVTLGWLGLGLGWQLLGYALNWPLHLGLALVGVGIATWLIFKQQPTLTELARGYDQRFALQQQIASALEAADQARPSLVVERLLEQATLSVRQFRHLVRKQSEHPWREWETLLCVALVMTALLLVVTDGLPASSAPIALPELPSAIPAAGTTAGPSDQPVSQTETPLGPEDQAASEAIADALRDTGATRGAAEALDQGDTSKAAEDLRELAQQADQLSDAAREQLGQDIQKAADSLRSSQPERAQALDEIAREMSQDPQKALEDLAEQLDGLGQQPDQANQGTTAVPQNGQPQSGQAQNPQGGGGQGAGQGQGLQGEHRTAVAEPPDVGSDLPLPTPDKAGGPTTNASGPQGPSVQLGAGGTGSTNSQTGSGSSAPIPGAADPLRIPPEDRDVVENYFSPTP